MFTLKSTSRLIWMDWSIWWIAVKRTLFHY